MIANKSRGEVAVPLGDGAFLRFTVDSLERLEAKHGPKWLDLVLDGLVSCQITIVKDCISVSINGGPRIAETGEVDFSEMRNVETIRSAIYDALFLMLYGKTFEEKKADEEKSFLEDTKKRLKAIDADPHLAALLFSQQFDRPVTEPASDQTKSAA